MANNLNIGAVVTPQDRQLLERVCEARGESLSSFIRRAIRKELAQLGYLDSETVRALGMQVTQSKGASHD
jgi:uncharacterized protein (DUF1778 family)